MIVTFLQKSLKSHYTTCKDFALEEIIMSRRQLKKDVLAILQKESLEEIFHDLRVIGIIVCLILFLLPSVILLKESGGMQSAVLGGLSRHLQKKSGGGSDRDATFSLVTQ